MLVPAPRELESHEGAFCVLPETAIELRLKDKTRAYTLLEPLQEEIREYYAGGLPLAGLAGGKANRILLQEDGGRGAGLHPGDHGGGDHGPRRRTPGLFYGVQTLRQLLRLHGPALPCLEIRIRPAYRYGVCCMCWPGPGISAGNPEGIGGLPGLLQNQSASVGVNAANFPYPG